jgi:hypothetical protein
LSEYLPKPQVYTKTRPSVPTGGKMADSNGVARVTSVLLDQMPKLNAACDEIAARANTTILRAAKVISDVSADFDRLDAAVSQLEDLRALGSNNPPATPELEQAVADRAAQVNVALAPGDTP